MDTTCEVCIRPLSEWGLLFEVSLHLREILMLHEIVEALVRRSEMLCIIVFHGGFDACALHRPGCDLCLIVVTLRCGLRSALGQSRVTSLLQSWQTAESVSSDRARERVRLGVSGAGRLILRAHHEALLG